MKKLLVVAIVVVMALTASVAMAAISGTKHDLSSSGAGSTVFTFTGNNNETCVFCHTPHGATTSAPLWNRSPMDTTGYTMYGATIGVLDAGGGYSPTAAAAAPPRTKTLVCMSCHDGVTTLSGIILNAPGAGAGSITATGQNTITGTYTNISKDLGNDHPVSIVYNDAVAGLRALTNIANYPDDVARVGSATQVNANTGASSYIECVSCHDVHASAVGSEVAFLRISNASSALCIACHESR